MISYPRASFGSPKWRNFLKKACTVRGESFTTTPRNVGKKHNEWPDFKQGMPWGVVNMEWNVFGFSMPPTKCVWMMMMGMHAKKVIHTANIMETQLKLAGFEYWICRFYREVVEGSVCKSTRMVRDVRSKKSLQSLQTSNTSFQIQYFGLTIGELLCGYCIGLHCGVQIPK